MAQDGTGGVFQTLAPLFEPGFKVIVRTPKLATVQPEDPPAFSDPRGILPAGLVPGSQISYQLLDQCEERVLVNNFEAAAFNVSLGFNQVIGQVTVSSKSTMAIICFEGRDVVDLPTDQLVTSDGGLVLPDKVFWPIFAGDKFIGPKDDLGKKVSLEFIKKSSSNALKGIVPSADAPLDSFSNSNGIFGANQPNIFDVASNKIALNGGASFVTYVACDKPLFRDVVTMNSSAICQGRFSGNDFTITLAAPFGDSIVTVYRYAFVNFETDPNAPARFQWRLAESFGAKVDKVLATPANLTLSAADKTADFLDADSKHYVYNLNDTGPDTDSKYPHTPIKQAYSPALAKAKLDSTSPFFDKNFKAQIIPFAKNQFFFQSRLEIKSIFGLSPAEGHGTNRIVQNRSYLSPSHVLNLGSKTRIGVEYIRHQFSHTNIFGTDELIALASTKPAAEGLGTYYDPCIKALVVILIEGGTVVQRLFNDKTWAISNIKVPEGKLKAFLIGENTEQSAGPTAIMPLSADLKLPISGTSGPISVPDDSIATAFEISPAKKSDNPTILELFAESDPTGTPACEIRIPPGVSTISIPATPFKSFNIVNPSGASLKKVFGAKKAYLDQMAAPTASTTPDKLDALVAFQLSQNKASEFPMKASACSTATLSIYGSAFIAYESLGRIDMAYRPSISVPFLVIRDMCFRVSETLTPADLSDSSKASFPSANLPFLVAVPQTSSVLLFYEYKDRILMKSIHSTVFSELDTVVKSSKFDATVESNAASSIMKMLPTVVYDGNIPDNKDGLKGDLAFGTISVFPSSTPPTTAPKNNDKPKIVQHSACMTKAGYVYCFIQDNSKIRVRRSSNSGKNWEDVFSSDTTFLPSKKDSDLAEESPSCFYDLSGRKVLLFFVVDSSILTMSIPEDILFSPMESASEKLKKIIPTVIYGNVSTNLKERGIQAQSTVIERQKASSSFNEAVTPHRIAIGRLDGGHLRLFFTDEQKKLKTLISTDSGNTWQTETQYVKSR